MAVSFEFCLLGPLVVRRDGLDVAVPAGKPRTVLAALLLDAGELVTVGRLAEVLWGADPPPSARVSVQNHVKRLRQALGEAGRARIRTEPGGYVMDVAAGELDVSRFQVSLAAARAAVRNRQWGQASAQASAALLLWRGEPLVGVDSELLVQQAVPYLAEIRLQAWETRLEAEMELGHHGDAIVELRRLTAAHPLREHPHALLMMALQRCGRQAEALAAYRAARRILISQLGAEPGPELRQAHQRVLDGDQSGAAAPGPAPLAPGGGRAVAPRQLPSPVRQFVGRDSELAVLTALLDRADVTPDAVLISAIGGTAGVGKTALAVRWAHQVAGWPCQPQVAPVFSSYLAPPGVARGREFSFDLAPPCLRRAGGRCGSELDGARRVAAGRAGLRDGVAHGPAELVDEAAESVDHGGQGVVTAGLAQVVLGRGGDLGLGAVEVEVVEDGVDVEEQVDDVAGAAGIWGDLGVLVVAGRVAHGWHLPGGARGS